MKKIVKVKDIPIGDKAQEFVNGCYWTKLAVVHNVAIFVDMEELQEGLLGSNNKRAVIAFKQDDELIWDMPGHSSVKPLYENELVEEPYPEPAKDVNYLGYIFKAGLIVIAVISVYQLVNKYFL